MGGSPENTSSLHWLLTEYIRSHQPPIICGDMVKFIESPSNPAGSGQLSTLSNPAWQPCQSLCLELQTQSTGLVTRDSADCVVFQIENMFKSLDLSAGLESRQEQFVMEKLMGRKPLFSSQTTERALDSQSVNAIRGS